MSNITVSIIVCVYNVEATIKQCLNSLVNQDIKNFEIIIIDDASTDDTAKVISSYLEKYPNIKYFKNHKNMGLFYNRQKGVQEASGEYIGFVDGDDYVELNMYSKMYNKAIEDSADIVHCNYKRVKNNKTYVDSGTILTEETKIKFQEDPLNMFLDGWGVSFFGIWNRLFKRDFWLKAKELKYYYNQEVYINMMEDTVNLFILSCYTSKHAFLDDFLYYYTFNKKSLVSLRRANMFYTLKSLESYKNGIFIVKEVLKSHNIWNKYKDKFYKFSNHIFEISGVKKIHYTDKKLLDKYFSLYKEIFNTYPNTKKPIQKLLKQNFKLKCTVIILLVVIVFLFFIKF